MTPTATRPPKAQNSQFLPTGLLWAHLGACYWALLSSCVAVSAEDMPRLSPAAVPVLESVAVNGPIFSDRRIARYDISTQDTFTTTDVDSEWGSWSGQGSSVTTNTSQRTEIFDNAILQRRFIRHLEDANFAGRIVPDGRYRLDATIQIEGDTSVAKIAWNVVNTCSGLLLIGGPYLGTSIVTAEVRAYDADHYVKTYSANARASWRVSGLWGLSHTVSDARAEALREAGDVALAKLVDVLLADAR